MTDDNYVTPAVAHAPMNQMPAAHRLDCTTLNSLTEVFPPKLQGSMGVFTTEADAKKIMVRGGHKRHFLKPNELITLKDATIAVSNQWGAGNIDNFIEAAKAAGFDSIEPVN